MKQQFLKVWRLPNVVVIHNNVGLAKRMGTSIPGPSQLDRWLTDPILRPAAMEMYETVGGHWGIQQTRWTNSDLKRRIRPKLQEAFWRGQFIALPIAHSDVAYVEPEVIPLPVFAKAQPHQKPKKEKTWIEIALLNEEGIAIPKAEYRLELADGSTRKGTLDDKGRIREEDIDPGTCTVCFPNLEADAKAVGSNR